MQLKKSGTSSSPEGKTEADKSSKEEVKGKVNREGVERGLQKDDR